MLYFCPMVQHAKYACRGRNKEGLPDMQQHEWGYNCTEVDRPRARSVHPAHPGFPLWAYLLLRDASCPWKSWGMLWLIVWVRRRFLPLLGLLAGAGSGDLGHGRRPTGGCVHSDDYKITRATPLLGGRIRRSSCHR